MVCVSLQLGHLLPHRNVHIGQWYRREGGLKRGSGGSNCGAHRLAFHDHSFPPMDLLCLRQRWRHLVAQGDCLCSMEHGGKGELVPHSIRRMAHSGCPSAESLLAASHADCILPHLVVFWILARRSGVWPHEPDDTGALSLALLCHRHAPPLSRHEDHSGAQDPRLPGRARHPDPGRACLGGLCNHRSQAPAPSLLDGQLRLLAALGAQPGEVFLLQQGGSSCWDGSFGLLYSMDFEVSMPVPHCLANWPVLLGVGSTAKDVLLGPGPARHLCLCAPSFLHSVLHDGEDERRHAQSRCVALPGDGHTALNGLDAVLDVTCHQMLGKVHLRANVDQGLVEGAASQGCTMSR
mmetsp:Transcript_64450/g.153826  ORF Transcript_64450/g.153826 Transcript_64450/m.153826 type:complete len:350 (+) Transcript_64450:683-1732(+)